MEVSDMGFEVKRFPPHPAVINLVGRFINSLPSEQ
jgi:hypothetical protein